MRNKIILPASALTSAAVAFGLGALVFNGHEIPTHAATPSPTTTVTARPLAAPQPSHATAVAPAHAKPATTPEKPAQRAAMPKPGSSGPLKDAQGDGKLLDDLAGAMVPNLPSIPDMYMPFPGHGEGLPTEDATDPSGDVTEYPYDPSWGDDPDNAADPGVVCGEEVAARVGVDVSPSCPETAVPVPMEATDTPSPTATP